MPYPSPSIPSMVATSMHGFVVLPTTSCTVYMYGGLWTVLRVASGTLSPVAWSARHAWLPLSTLSSLFSARSIFSDQSSLAQVALAPPAPSNHRCPRTTVRVVGEMPCLALPGFPCHACCCTQDDNSSCSGLAVQADRPLGTSCTAEEQNMAIRLASPPVLLAA